MKELGTKDRIRRAAAKVFTEKGYDAATTRDIAKEAGIKNMASLHYYYGTKEELFELIIREKMAEFTKIMERCFTSDIPLYEKIRSFVPAYIDFYKANPYLPLFVLFESEKNAEKINQYINDDKFRVQLENEISSLAERGIIRPISLANFYCNLIGMVIFPFLSKTILFIKTGLDEAGFQEMLEERKQMIPDMIINYLYLKAPE